MRIVITGAGGNVGRGVAPKLLDAGHEVVLSDLPGVGGFDPRAEAAPADVRVPGSLDEVVAGADLLLHLPAWHGIHSGERTEAEFWSLNLDGTVSALQSAVAAGVPRVVWLSSQAIHNPWDKYGFTKVIGEQVLEYTRRAHGLTTVAVRPGSFTPWTGWVEGYGRDLLYGRVDREDVLDAVVLAVDWAGAHEGSLVLDAVQPDSFGDEDLSGWSADPVGTLERVFPGSRAVVERFGIDVSRPPERPNTGGWAEAGYRPSRDFGTWVREVSAASDDEVAARTPGY